MFGEVSMSPKEEKYLNNFSVEVPSIENVDGSESPDFEVLIKILKEKNRHRTYWREKYEEEGAWEWRMQKWKK